MVRLRFGCSGWDYQEWIGPVYRNATESKLRAYSRIFDTAEINSTFYRAPSPGMVLGWARYTPEDLVFAAKVPQTVTHDRLLDLGKGADKALPAYCELMRPLLDAGKLGPLLLQQPLPRLRAGELHPDLADARSPDARAGTGAAADRRLPQAGDGRGSPPPVAHARGLWRRRAEGCLCRSGASAIHGPEPPGPGEANRFAGCRHLSGRRHDPRACEGLPGGARSRRTDDHPRLRGLGQACRSQRFLQTRREVLPEPPED